MPFDNNSAYQARRELAILSELIAEATTARDEAQQTYDRLAKPASLLEEAVTQHAAEKAIHDAQLVVWYNNGCIGERPSTPSSLLLAEHRIGEARRDLGASATALEIAMSGLRAASEHLAELHLRYRGALYRAAVEAAAWRLQTRAAPVLIAALNEFAGVESVQTELRNRGFGPDPHPEALSASREIGRLISTVRQSIGVRGDLERARQFLDELASNPEATLPDPGEPIVELIEPRMEKPMVDGSQFLNRSTPEEQVSEPVPPDWPNPAIDPDGAWRRMHPDPVWGSAMSKEAASAGANSPLAPELVPMPSTELPAWLDSGGVGFRPPLLGR